MIVSYQAEGTLGRQTRRGGRAGPDPRPVARPERRRLRPRRLLRPRRPQRPGLVVRADRRQDRARLPRPRRAREPGGPGPRAPAARPQSRPDPRAAGVLRGLIRIPRRCCPPGAGLPRGSTAARSGGHDRSGTLLKHSRGFSCARSDDRDSDPRSREIPRVKQEISRHRMFRKTVFEFLSTIIRSYAGEIRIPKLQPSLHNHRTPSEPGTVSDALPTPNDAHTDCHAGHLRGGSGQGQGSVVCLPRAGRAPRHAEAGAARAGHRGRARRGALPGTGGCLPEMGRRLGGGDRGPRVGRIPQRLAGASRGMGTTGDPGAPGWPPSARSRPRSMPGGSDTISGDGSGPQDAPTASRLEASSATNRPISRTTSARGSFSASASRRTRALPTIRPSATGASVRTCSGVLIPKPMQIGRSVCVRSQATFSASSGGSASARR